MALAVSLDVVSGEQTGVRYPIPSSAVMRVGRVRPAEIVILDDPLLSAHHFTIERTGETCRFVDSGSRFGTLHNGRPSTGAELKHGDTLLAGRTRFAVAFFDDESVTPHFSLIEETAKFAESLPTIPTAPRQSLRRELRDWFFALRDPLFAIMDASREATIPERLSKSGDQHASLFEGKPGKAPAPFDPWLVRLQKGSPLLDELLAEGWGRSWGVYLTCHLPFAEVRDHLRRFLSVKLADGRQVYFRFYDPRVQRAYFQTCSTEELAEFFGPIREYITESADSDSVLLFSRSYKNWQKIVLK